MSRRTFRRCTSLSSLDLNQLKQIGIRGIILDLDNTIVSEDDRYLSPNSESWIERAQEEGFSLFILSNGKREYRVNYWSERLGIDAIGRAKKPFPKSFKIALYSMRLLPIQVVVIGDGFHTDAIGALWNGCHCVQVASLPHKARWWEKIIGRWVQIPYPKHAPLWSFNPQYYSSSFTRTLPSIQKDIT
ncbi:YqeG family HAD IIIA-type phosphatase [Synechococcus sp. PCC 7336]|uniref:YqeG family HAD IIIA-type phosphatase n=1 Tax=Synechococcus sp. PCC 7336 TaxID=195250 RepID=UPI00034B38A5